MIHENLKHGAVCLIYDADENPRKGRGSMQLYTTRMESLLLTI